MVIIDGKILANIIKDEIALEVVALAGERPNLAIILVGERPDSELYVSLKEKQAKTVGIDTHTYRIPEVEGEAGLLEVIAYLNEDPLIDAILLQLPLPEGFDEDKAVALINPLKEVDGFHPEILHKYLAGEPTVATPVVPTVVREMLEAIKYDCEGKTACVVSNSKLFGETLCFELENLGLATDIVSIDDEELADMLRDADVVVTAVGRAQYLKGDMIKEDAVLIDIGISNMEDGAVVGDVDFASVKDKALFITPVPGGVGPMTIAVALRNALRLKQAKQ